MAEDFDDRPYALVVLLPAESDAVNAASSEDIAHMTFVWFGDVSDDETEEGTAFDAEPIRAQLAEYAATTTPITVPVASRGELGDDGADVLFMEGTDSLMALRDGLMAYPDVQAAHDATTQYPEWTPHVTLGYPEEPATGEYAGDEITFDRFALWVGNDRQEFPMGASITAAATLPDEPEAELPEDVDLDDEELVDDVPAEIPVHGVMAVSGRPTGDGRMFARDGLTYGTLPAPLGYEFESSHGGDNSKVATVGRIDEMWAEDKGDHVEHRFRGVIMPAKPYANQAIEGIVDGSFRGLSVKVDDVVIDVTEEREQMRERIKADNERSAEAAAAEAVDDAPPSGVMSDEEIDEILDAFIGDGTIPLTVFAQARVRNFDMVNTGALMEAWIGLGPDFTEDDELVEVTEDEAEALVACGCAEVVETDDEFTEQLREISTEERKKLAEEGKALPDGSFPIENEEDLRNAIQAIGRASDPDAAKAHIEKRARELGKEDLIPEDWSVLVAAPGTKDGPGWITHPRATARIRRYWVRGKGAAKIRWGEPGDFNRCRSQLAKYVQNPDWLAGLCANMHKEALGIWPAQHHSAASVTASVGPRLELIGGPESLVAAPSLTKLPAAAFRRPPELDQHGAGLVMDGDRVYGYIAEWGTCHLDFPGACTTPPFSTSDYAYFATGYVSTDEGDIRVGQLTMDTTHAGGRLTASAAAQHYANTGAVVADVAVGEDSRGIWYAGLVRSDATPQERHALKASGRVSGDWRTPSSSHNLELVAALVVNTPGFPIPHTSLAASAGLQTSLIAAGMVEPEPEPVEAVTASLGGLTAEDVVAISRNAVAEYRHQEELAARVRETADTRATLRKQRRDAALARIGLGQS